MKRVAIVGVEGSGKTVMLAGLGDLYSRPDEKGYFLVPKDFRTSAYVSEMMGRLRSGRWPEATVEDMFLGLDWTLKRRSSNGGTPTDICELSCLDFAGEVYRKAFVEPESQIGNLGNLDKQVEALWNYVERADLLLVLVNLRDVIHNRGAVDRRINEAVWVSNGILKMALRERSGRVPPRAAIVLSQADAYAATIEELGGARPTLEKYLPNLYYSYESLPVFSAHTIDKTVLDDDGSPLPDPAFTTEGLRPIMDWILEKRAKQPDKSDGNHNRDLLVDGLILFTILLGILLAIVFCCCLASGGANEYLP